MGAYPPVGWWTISLREHPNIERVEGVKSRWGLNFSLIGKFTVILRCTDHRWVTLAKMHTHDVRPLLHPHFCRGITALATQPMAHDGICTATTSPHALGFAAVSVERPARSSSSRCTTRCSPVRGSNDAMRVD